MTTPQATVESSVDQFKDSQVTDLRKLLRKAYPEASSLAKAWISVCSKDDAASVLGGAVKLDTAVTEWAKREGAAVSHSAPLSDAAVESSLAAAIKAMEAIGRDDLLKGLREARVQLAASDSVAKELTEVRQSLHDVRHASSAKPTQTHVDGNGYVEICGTKFDKVSSKSSNVPRKEYATRYNFSAWRGVAKAGNLAFDVGAQDVLAMLKRCWRVYLVGEASVGKTSFLNAYAALVEQPLVRFQCHKEVSVVDFVGGYEVGADSNGNSTMTYTNGPLLTAMEEGAILVLDEVAHMPAQCSSVLHGVMECNRDVPPTIQVPGTSKTVTAHPDFRLVCTGNADLWGGSPSGEHDPFRYADSANRGAAFASRVHAVIYVDWMKKEDEVSLLVSATGCSHRDAESIVEVATATRDIVKQGDALLCPIDMRGTIAWADGIADFGIGKAFALTVVAKAPLADRAALVEIAQRHLGADIKGADDAGSENEGSSESSS